jgi:hypothetical protein
MKFYIRYNYNEYKLFLLNEFIQIFYFKKILSHNIKIINFQMKNNITKINKKRTNII